MKTPLCAVPFVECFSDPGGGFRNCCCADPQILSDSKTSFQQWWGDAKIKDFRDRMFGNQLPSDCWRCQTQEQQNQESFRLAVNKALDWNTLDLSWPSRWNVIFGNTCNLACWSCSENSSSVIENQKKHLGRLPLNWISPNDRFREQWPNLRESILQSYDVHETVSITLLGGEPLFNRSVLDFLQELRNMNLSSRTRLEFHTNGTQVTDKIRNILMEKCWQYICIFISVDAVGRKAEWLRYGTIWEDIEKNTSALKSIADYTEIHCTLGVLNLRDLPALEDWCKKQDLPLKIMLISDPSFMALKNWDGPPKDLVSGLTRSSDLLHTYLDMVGEHAIAKSQTRLQEHIQAFSAVRKALKDFDPDLSRSLQL